ncbi:MAG: 2-oxoglutarate dehydrogenase E1 component [Deltaproteobacteria bacterium]|nr:MAG: 2-oxoglutarate dehydrogenase E1 component [Deltaproteobacteria bacterium]
MNLLTNSGNLPYIEELYAAYRKNPASVGPEWRTYFSEIIENGRSSTNGNDTAADILPAGIDTAGTRSSVAPSFASTLQEQLNDMVRAYRTLGHRAAYLDPLGQQPRKPPELDPAFYGLTAERVDQLFSGTGLYWPGPQTLREIVRRLRETYCGSIGVEFMHIEDRSIREWLQEKIETNDNRLELDQTEQRQILTQLIHAATFEQFTRNQFVGAKSFSLEGAESLIPLLIFAIEKAAREGLREIVLAMAHRGRLNVLVNVIGKKPQQIFREFLDLPPPADGGGDVKYHLGYSGDYQTSTGPKMHLSLCFNPSHLEFVNPVAVGRVRAKQDRSGDAERERGLALLIHGEAAFAGEGVVQETLNMSQLAAYGIGGTLHVIVNNQVGFTTYPSEGRSTSYASDIAKMLQIPIFHVNGDDPEAVQQAAALAMDFRRRYRRDAVIDMVCYRRYGHNESDDPSFTQPKMYRAIRQHPPVAERYIKQLIEQRLITREQADRLANEFRDLLEQELALARTGDAIDESQSYGGIWSGYGGGLEPKGQEITSAVAQERLSQLLDWQTRFPANFHPHPKIARFATLRREMAAGKRPLDWAAAEALAFASLACEGVRVRLSGQDTARGTFSQRHAVLHDFDNGDQYTPLNHLTPDQSPVEIYNSPLSEAGVLGFEYGYSLDYPDALVLWEAQFGDFVNAAQVIVDQFISSAEEKWRRLSGLVLLLPHGFEGMGPEHSSARMERFLQLGTRDNLQVVYPTTPAQYFHCLRRQALRKWRKPLVILTPKSLLRHRDATSSLTELSQGRFETVIGEPRSESIVKRILLCSGKVYYELKSHRAERQRDDVAIVRLEQLYPTPTDALAAALGGYPERTPVVWVQEEPSNMGALCFWSLQFGTRLFDRYPLTMVARPPSASPATGSAWRHREQQAQLLAAAFGEVG